MLVTVLRRACWQYLLDRLPSMALEAWCLRIHGSQTCQPILRGLFRDAVQCIHAVPLTYAVLVCSMSRLMIWN
jgi:hypothetical protein